MKSKGLLSLIVSLAVLFTPYLPVAIVTPVAISMAGCPTSQQWFDIVGALLPILGNTYLQFYQFTQKGGVDPADITKVQELTTAGQDAVNKIKNLVKTVQGNMNAGTIGEINAVIDQLSASVDGFLADAQIKNSARFADYSMFAKFILADVKDIATLVPIVTPLSASTPAKGVKVTMHTSLPKAKAMKSVFQFRLDSLKKM